MSPFAPENYLVSRDGLGSPVPRQPAHLPTQAESVVLTYGEFLPSSAVVSTYLIFKLPYAIGPGPEFIGSRDCIPMAFTAERPPAQDQ